MAALPVWLSNTESPALRTSDKNLGGEPYGWVWTTSGTDTRGCVLRPADSVAKIIPFGGKLPALVVQVFFYAHVDLIQIIDTEF